MVKQYALRLKDGRTIYLEQLFQYRTYNWLMAGFPDPGANQEIVLSASRYVEEKLWGSGQPHVIQPVERPVEVPDEVRQKYLYPLRLLPYTVCLAVFESLPPARDPAQAYSFLKVVWFQDEFALPVDPHIEEHLRAMDWTTLATDATD
jgi:hypothetical protein